MGINVKKEEKTRRLMAMKDDKLMESTRELAKVIRIMFTHIIYINICIYISDIRLFLSLKSIEKHLK